MNEIVGQSKKEIVGQSKNKIVGKIKEIENGREKGQNTVFREKKPSQFVVDKIKTRLSARKEIINI